jgi:hypothetical protein
MRNGALHKDPTFDAVVALEIRELGCKACVRRLTLSTGAVRCSQGKTFPRCKRELKGFKLDEGVNDG